MKSPQAIVSAALHTADADARMQAADQTFLTTFVTLTADDQARCWRGLDHGAKFRLVVRRIEALGMSWMPSVVEAQIAKYDERFAAGPVDAAVEGALERLALSHSDAARLADQAGDKAHRKAERAAATAFTNALIQYRAGVRPEILPSGARLIASSTIGKPAHLLTIDGDWICNCAAGANWHWPLALCIGIEQAYEDMNQFDDGDIDVELACAPPNEPEPLGDEEGDELPAARSIGERIAEARATYQFAA